MERIQNIKDTEQNIEYIAEVLGIDKDYITYDEEEQVYLISTLQELEIKKEVDFSQLRNFPLKFTKCHFSQGLLVYEQEFKEKLIFDNVVFSKSINFSRNTFSREVGFFGCEFENKLYQIIKAILSFLILLGLRSLNVSYTTHTIKKTRKV
ncbi:MAG: pentapeptide repeat-containing protein [Helicobacter sp.]|nr:pentapeptide repeat-containing protein [Helicobacter sp.]